MKIGSVDVRIAILPLVVFAVFSFGFLFAAFFGPPDVAAQVKANLIWIIPGLILLLVIIGAFLILRRLRSEKPRPAVVTGAPGPATAETAAADRLERQPGPALDRGSPQRDPLFELVEDRDR